MGGRRGKDYYLGIQREREFGQDAQGHEWQNVIEQQDERGYITHRLQIIQE